MPKSRTKKRSAAKSTPHTKAFLAFEENLKTLGHMILLSGREITLIKTQATRLATLVKKLGDLTKKPATTKLARSVKRFGETVTSGTDRFNTAYLWQVVILVTCIETYLQDLLSSAAGVDPRLMKESQQTALYADVIAAVSLDELANKLRSRWARGFLSDGGPPRWITRLKKMGARGYPVDLAPRMDLIWGIRHAVVHAAGVADSDFVKRHPRVVKAAGDRLKVPSETFKGFLKATSDFVDPTERWCLKRFPSLRVKPSGGALGTSAELAARTTAS